MRLDNLAVAIHPRSSWEALDLGSLLARRWFVPLWFCYVGFALPFWLVFSWVFRFSPEWVMLCFWWFKPFYERPLLFFLSRVVFGDSLGFRGVFVALPGLLSRQWFWWLSFFRLSLCRSFNQCVVVLEGLSGKAYRQRINDLYFMNGAKGGGAY